jgi:hypothetical protein
MRRLTPAAATACTGFFGAVAKSAMRALYCALSGFYEVNPSMIGSRMKYLWGISQSWLREGSCRGGPYRGALHCRGDGADIPVSSPCPSEYQLGFSSFSFLNTAKRDRR